MKNKLIQTIIIIIINQSQKLLQLKEFLSKSQMHFSSYTWRLKILGP